MKDPNARMNNANLFTVSPEALGALPGSDVLAGSHDSHPLRYQLCARYHVPHYQSGGPGYHHYSYHYDSDAAEILAYTTLGVLALGTVRNAAPQRPTPKTVYVAPPRPPPPRSGATGWTVPAPPGTVPYVYGTLYADGYARGYTEGADKSGYKDGYRAGCEGGVRR